MKGWLYLKSSRELRHQAWEQLRKSYWMVFLVTLIVSLVPTATSVAIIGLLLVGPFAVGQQFI